MFTLKNALGPFAVIAAVFVLAGATSSFAHEKSNSDSAMKQCMSMSHSGKADADFIRNMIPHHQMALDMAKDELKKGKDPAAREMARNIIDAQTKEISMMRAWLKDRKQ